MTMLKDCLLIMAAVALLLVAACAPRLAGHVSVHDTAKKVSTVFIWDVDGHTDLSLLRGLKAEAARQLSAAGYMVSTDPNAAGAYVKVTVDDALEGPAGFVMGKLYIVDAKDSSIIYDKTCEAGSAGEGYPMAAFIGCALDEFSGHAGKGH